MTDNLPATLDDLGKAIRDTLDRADTSQRRADDLRITAGQMLLVAQQRVHEQKLVWSEWLKTNIPDRSDRDVRRLIALAKAPDPEAAIEEDRRKAREGMRRTKFSPQPVDATEHRTRGRKPGTPRRSKEEAALVAQFRAASRRTHRRARARGGAAAGHDRATDCARI
jgi:hypothetical protein